MIASRTRPRVALPSVACRWPSARRRAGARGGHSLLELMVALPLAALVLGAASTALYVASQSRQLTEGLLADKVESLVLSDRLLQDVRSSLSFAELETHAIEMTVPDRDGDGEGETIRYAWSGVAGDALLHQFNDNPATELAADVQLFDLGYTQLSGELIDEATGLTVLKHHNDAKRGKMKEWKIKVDKWCAQYFLPDLPADATTWELHRVGLMAKRKGDMDGVVRVQVTTADAGLQPTATVLEAHNLEELDLDKNFSWFFVDFWTLKNLAPDQGLCIVLSYESGSDDVTAFRYEQNGTNMTTQTHFMTSVDAGLSWSPPGSDDDLRFFVYGKHDGTSQQRKFLREVRLQVQVGADPQTLAESAAMPLNAPEVSQ